MADILDTTQQVVLSVRIKGDAGPQTGDVVLGSASFPDFSTTDTYDKNEVIVYKGSLYRAKEQMNAGGFDPTKWEPLTDIIARLPDFEPLHTYNKDEIVLYGENLYRAKTDFTAGTKFEPTDWFGVDTVDVCIRDFAPSATYDKDEMIIRDGKLYRAVQNFISTNTWQAKDWELISDLTISDFTPNFDYKRNNIAIVAGNIYRAKNDFTSGTTFDPNDWEKIGNVSIGNFTASTYYSEGSLITHQNKLYKAKADFTSGAMFQATDWDVLSDVIAEEFKPNEHYIEDHLVVYNGGLYRAKTDFTSATNFDAADWDLLCPMRVGNFSANTSYYKEQLIVEDGSLYRAKSAFTSGSTFDPFDWEKLGSNTLQVTYANSSNNFTTPAEVRPAEVTFEEYLRAYNSDSAVKSFTDNQAGRETLITGVDLDQTSTAVLWAQRTGANTEEADLRITNIDALAKVGLVQAGSDPYAIFELVDNKNEHFKIQVKQGDCKVEMSTEVQNALTASLGKMSDTTRGLAKTDGRTTRIDTSTDSINAYPIPTTFNAGTQYFENEVVAYNKELFLCKTDFVSGTNFDMNDWLPMKVTIAPYKPGRNYYAGDLIVDAGFGVVDFYYANKDIPNAPTVRNNADWTKQVFQAGTIEFVPSSAAIITSTNVQMALVELDNYIDQTVDVNIDTLQSDYTALEARVTAIETEQTTQNSRLTALEASDTTNTAAITAAQTTIATLQADLATAQTDIATLQADNATLRSDISTLQSDYAALEARVTALGG